mgnify:CR=1 FL=1
MKKIIALLICLFLSACNYVTDPVEYKQVTVMPITESEYVPVHPVDVT